MTSLLFIDTEFTRLPTHDCLDPSARPMLISIGLVSEDGKNEFYREVAGWKVRDCSDFVRRHVLPHLRGPRVTPEVVKTELWTFLSGLPGQVQVAGDYSGDWQFMLAALGGIRPPNVEPAFFNLSATAGPLDLSPFLSPDRPQHHALNDARALRLAYSKWREDQ